MEDADLSFASLLLALRHSNDELDKPNFMPTVKTPLNFHKDFYRNSSYDNECSNAAESLTTLSSCSTDIDSPIGGVVVNRNPPLSSIGWKRRSDPCISTAGLLIENEKEFPASAKSSISGTKSFDYGPVVGNQSSIANGFQPYIFTDGISRKPQANNPEIKKLCRPSSASRSESQGGRTSSKNKASSASQESSSKSGENSEKIEMQKEIISNRKTNRELKNSKKEVKEHDKEVSGTGEGSVNDKSCFETFIGICQSAEDQKDLEAAAKNEARLLKIARGRYKCSRCGALKTNHDCPIIEEYAGSVATQIERITLKPEEFLSGGIAGFSAALRTCNLLSVRGNYCPAASHPVGLVNHNNSNSSSNSHNHTSKSSSNSSRSHNNSSSMGGKNDILLSAPPVLDFARSPAFNSTMQRSMSYSAVGALCGNDTDHNTTNSNSDNDSDSKSSTRGGKTFQHNHSTDSEASAAPCILPTAASISPLSSNRLTMLSVPSLNGLESKIGGMGVFSVGKETSNTMPFSSNRSEKSSAGGDLLAIKRELTDSKCSPGSYHLTYQTISYSGNSSSNASALPSPRDHDIPLPL